MGLWIQYMSTGIRLFVCMHGPLSVQPLPRDMIDTKEMTEVIFTGGTEDPSTPATPVHEISYRVLLAGAEYRW
jgi:hypothetical protein